MNRVGFSTGALALGDFRAALSQMRREALSAVELSAIRMEELPLLLNAVPSLDLSQFGYIAVHAPSRFSPEKESEIATMLRGLPESWKIVLHPDAIHNPSNWVGFGQRLALENMDRRKPTGRSATELSQWFDRLPEARLCLDLAHAQQWDTTMTEAYQILKQFSARICQVHVSQLDSASHHYPLSASSIRAFSEVAWLIPRDAAIIIESRVTPEEMKGEILKVRQALNLALLETPESVTA
jgi:hypothetical protein